MATKVVYVKPREKTEKINFDSLVMPAVIIGGLVGYAYYKDDIVAALDNAVSKLKSKETRDLINKILHPNVKPLEPIDLPDLPRGGGGTPVGSSQFGSGDVSLHTLSSSGESAWRKQWEVHRRYLNCQFSGYFLIPAGSTGISIKLRGGPHSDSSPREGCCYIFFLPFNGSSKNNFQKECPHPVYDKNTVPVKFNAGSIIGRWTGIMCRLINQGGGVRCQMYLDTSGRAGANQWRLWYDILDSGQYGSGASRPPFTNSPVNGSNPQAIVRIDASSQGQASKYQMAYGSIGEISGANIAHAYFDRITMA